MASKPPKQISVGPFTWTVVPNASLDDEFGLTDFRRLELKLVADMPPDLHRETVLHELLHCVLWAHGMSASKQEPIVQTLSPMLYQALRDNPDLRRFLFG